MASSELDEGRERRIDDEIVVDAYSEEEQALGWYYYLEDRLAFPFQARTVGERRISPLRPGEVVEVTGMAPEDDSMHEMFVLVRWHGRTFGVPLAQMVGLSVDDQTREAIGDWHYWIDRGYQL